MWKFVATGRRKEGGRPGYVSYIEVEVAQVAHHGEIWRTADQPKLQDNQLWGQLQQTVHPHGPVMKPA